MLLTYKFKNDLRISANILHISVLVLKLAWNSAAEQCTILCG